MVRSALTIAGLDPSGGAGIAADLRGFSAAGVWGCSVCAVLTVQSTRGLVAAYAVPAARVAAQAEEVLTCQRVGAMKTGALGSAANVEAVLRLATARDAMPLVVDPVLVATRAPGGATLLDRRALGAMRELCRDATLVTPNVDEAEALLRGTIRSAGDARDAAAALLELGAHAVLVKGGHLPGEEVHDVLATRRRVLVLVGRRIGGPPVHGGGCTLAALVAGRLAREGALRRAGDAPLEAAVRWARRTLRRSIRAARAIGPGLRVLPLPSGGGVVARG